MIMKCPHCKNKFDVVRGLMREYVYKIRIGKSNNFTYYCSYPCWRAEGGGNGKTHHGIQD